MSEKVTLLARFARSTAPAAMHPPESLCSTEQPNVSVHDLLSTEGSSGDDRHDAASEVRLVRFALP
jgi:hypothetical protein